MSAARHTGLGMPRQAAFAILTGLLLSGDAAEADRPVPSVPSGVWVGRCGVEGKDVFVLLRLQPDGGRVTGLAFSPALGVSRPVSKVEGDGGRLALSFATSHGTVRLSCEVSGDAIEGTAECRGSKGTCGFRRRQPMDAAALDAIRGDYQLSPDRVVYIGRFNTPRYLFLCD